MGSQIKIIENTTRYVSLLFLGICSTFLVLVATLIYNPSYNKHWAITPPEFGYTLMALDNLLNVICLYLQYSFMVNIYNKYSNGIRLCWRCLLTKIAMNSQERRYKTAANESYNDDGDDKMGHEVQL